MMLTQYDRELHGLTPPPGIYSGAPFRTYQDWPYLSKSALGDFIVSPAQHRAAVAGLLPTKTSDAFTVGSATDALWVERKQLVEADGWHVLPADLPGKGKRYQAYVDERPHLELLNQEQAGRAQAMARALELHSVAHDLRLGAEAQLSLVWDCPRTGIRRKGRPDLVDLERRRVIDLKTAWDIRAAGFASACSDYNYHWQLEGYREALLELLGGDDDWQAWFVVVRNKPVHGVACRPMSSRALDCARGELGELLEQYRDCAITNHWPADLDGLEPIEMPRWRYKQRSL